MPSLSPAGELRAMLRDVDAPDGLRRIATRLARRLDATVVLVEPAGPLPVLPAALAADVAAIAAGRVDATSIVVDGRWSCALPIAATAPRPVLLVRRNGSDRPFVPAERGLLAEATTLLDLAWRERQAGWRQERLRRAEMRTRQTVLQLLLAGAIDDARGAGAALGPALPDPIRVHLVELPADRVAEAIEWCNRIVDRSGWVVRFPADGGRIVVLAHGGADELLDALQRRAASDPAIRVGSSQLAPLDQFSSALRHASHALSVARDRPERHAAFQDRGDLAAILADVGGGWARRTLAALLAYRPARPQDPDSDELVLTLGSWLTCHGAAARHLRLHRNTVAARLRLIEALLGVDLGQTATQARLQLAIQLVGRPGRADAQLTELLARPEVRDWADGQREPLVRCGDRLLDTVRVWLDQGASIGSTALALGISMSGVRKRIIRVERLLRRPLLDSPSDRCALWLALATHDDSGRPLFEPAAGRTCTGRWPRPGRQAAGRLPRRVLDVGSSGGSMACREGTA